jgi:hypothetical protein
VGPVEYGEGVAGRVREAAGRVDAFIDTFGGGYVELALELGVRPDRINTIFDFEAAARYGVRTAGGVRSAYRELAARHTHGKIVLRP